jgi:DNA topoisomerase-1
LKRGMPYTLILTEKPSAAQKIAQSLADGKVEQLKRNDAPYYRITRSGKEIVVVPAVGHLFILSQTGKNSKWTYPVFEVEWKPTYQGRNSMWARKYYTNIQALVKGAKDFVSATDYDVEGSVISYNIFRFIFNQKDGRRMKFSTLTREDIVEAYENASKHLEFPMIEAGLTRHRLDWYFGINLSRALTLSLEHSGGYWVLSTGRVQGPTLKILSERQKEIEAFVPVPYWLLELSGMVSGKEISALHVNDKFWKKRDVESSLERCREGKGFRDGTVQEIKKTRRRESPPFPFDLTTLQRESYSLFGYSPMMTLNVAQSLYEHALISYPRTSSQKLPEKLGFRKILSGLSQQAEYSALCGKLMKGRLKPNEGKKEDPAHPAIFPTGQKPKRLSSYQRKIYDLIVRRFLSTFAEPAIREQTRALINVNGELFASHGVTTLKKGWLEFYGPYSRAKEQALHGMSEGDVVKVSGISIIDKETEPPPRYSQASILKDMEALNLGTKATRAGILQTLYDRSYIKGHSIEVTELGKSVIEALHKHCPEIISVDLTKRFEEEMEKIEAGKEKRKDVVVRAEKELRRILDDFKSHEKEIGKHILKAVKEFEKEIHTLGRCPKCGTGELHIMHSHRTGKRFVGCTNYPKCKNSFPLPGIGYLIAIDRTCKCGLKLVEVRRQGRRPWRMCAVHGFNYYDKKRPAKGKDVTGRKKESRGTPREMRHVSRAGGTRLRSFQSRGRRSAATLKPKSERKEKAN